MPAVPFEYHVPATIADAVALLVRHGDRARPLAGGQSLVPLLTMRLARPDVVVDLNEIEGLRDIRRDGDDLIVGAMVRHRELERGERGLAACPVLQEAAALIGNVRVRTLGTVGGSLAHADPAAELPAVARALDAVLILTGPEGERTVPAGEFFTGALTTALRPAELVTRIRFPVLGPGTGYAITEFTRRGGDFAIVAAVAIVDLGPNGRISRARVALAGVDATPVRLVRVEAALAGELPEIAVLRRASNEAAGEIHPEGDAHASAAYRRHLARVLTARALERAARVAAERRTA